MPWLIQFLAISPYRSESPPTRGKTQTKKRRRARAASVAKRKNLLFRRSRSRSSFMERSASVTVGPRVVHLSLGPRAADHATQIDQHCGAAYDGCTRFLTWQSLF